MRPNDIGFRRDASTVSKLDYLWPSGDDDDG